MLKWNIICAINQKSKNLINKMFVNKLRSSVKWFWGPSDGFVTLWCIELQCFFLMSEQPNFNIISLSSHIWATVPWTTQHPVARHYQWNLREQQTKGCIKWQKIPQDKSICHDHYNNLTGLFFMVEPTALIAFGLPIISASCL